VPVEQALAQRTVSLRVGFAACEFDLGSIASLRVGDVVPLAHSLHAPLIVSSPQGMPLCRGFLGRQGEMKAVELAPADGRNVHEFPITPSTSA
jgi:flagellar motor switch protein FliM